MDRTREALRRHDDRPGDDEADDTPAEDGGTDADERGEADDPGRDQP
jgi:hypothetical protein